MENSAALPPKKHSILGILSLGLVLLFIMILTATIIGTYVDDTITTPSDLQIKINTVLTLCTLGLLPISQILAVISLIQPKTKKLFGILSLVINGIVCIPVSFVLFLVLMQR